jgi:hypothetical protein
MSVVHSIIEVSPKERYTLKRFNITATYEYEAEGILAKDEDEAYKIFLANLNDYYSGMEDYSCEEDGDVCEDCEDDTDDCECEEEDD